MKTSLIAVAALTATALPCAAQSPVAGLLKPVPLKKLEGAGYLRVKIQVSAPAADAGAGNPMGGILGMLGGMLGGAASGLQDVLWPILNGVAAAGPDTFYTNLTPRTLAGESFFLVYQPETHPVAMEAMNASKPPLPRPLTAQTPLVAGLVNARHIVRISDVRTFSLAEELAQSAARLKAIKAFAAEQQKKADNPPAETPSGDSAKPASIAP